MASATDTLTEPSSARHPGYARCDLLSLCLRWRTAFARLR